MSFVFLSLHLNRLTTGSLQLTISTTICQGALMNCQSVPHAGIIDTSSCVGSGDVNQILMFAEQVLLFTEPFFFQSPITFSKLFFTLSEIDLLLYITPASLLFIHLDQAALKLMGSPSTSASRVLELQVYTTKTSSRSQVF